MALFADLRFTLSALAFPGSWDDAVSAPGLSGLSCSEADSLPEVPEDSTTAAAPSGRISTFLTFFFYFFFLSTPAFACSWVAGWTVSLAWWHHSVVLPLLPQFRHNPQHVLSQCELLLQGLLNLPAGGSFCSPSFPRFLVELSLLDDVPDTAEEDVTFFCLSI